MEDLAVKIINYLYALGGLAFVLEYMISKEKGEALVLKLIDWSDLLAPKNIDGLISRVSLFFLEKYDKIYGRRYFRRKEWIASAGIAFTYCYAFYLIEKAIGFESSLAKQIGYWFVPTVIADVISINFTRILLSKVTNNPNKYLKYLIYDIIVCFFCFYICFSFTILYLWISSDYGVSLTTPMEPPMIG
jgi:hypothetical protein